MVIYFTEPSVHYVWECGCVWGYGLWIGLWIWNLLSLELNTYHSLISSLNISFYLISQRNKTEQWVLALLFLFIQYALITADNYVTDSATEMALFVWSGNYRGGKNCLHRLPQLHLPQMVTRGHSLTINVQKIYHYLLYVGLLECVWIYIHFGLKIN